MTCGADGCTRRVHGKGFCGMHLQRMLRHGTTDAPYRSMDPESKFWSKVDRRGDNECWLWLGNRQPDGYGRIGNRLRPTSSGTSLAHRAAYELLVGPIPRGMQLDHLCRRPECVNPAHLEAVTPAENTRRGLHGVLRTKCLLGHPLTPDNTYVVPTSGHRRCRICLRAKATERRRRLAGAA